MKKLFIIFGLLISSISYGSSRLENMIRAKEKSVCYIETPTGSASGFLIEENIVATNKHVVNDTKIENILVSFPSSKNPIYGPFFAIKKWEDPNLDIAFVVLDTKGKKITINKQHRFSKGEEVIAIGSPGLRGPMVAKNTISHGYISNILMKKFELLYQVNMSLNPGNSGGPILDRNGKVVCMVVGGIPELEQISFCIPAIFIANSFQKAISYLRE